MHNKDVYCQGRFGTLSDAGNFDTGEPKPVVLSFPSTHQKHSPVFHPFAVGFRLPWPYTMVWGRSGDHRVLG